MHTWMIYASGFLISVPLIFSNDASTNYIHTFWKILVGVQFTQIHTSIHTTYIHLYILRTYMHTYIRQILYIHVCRCIKTWVWINSVHVHRTLYLATYQPTVQSHMRSGLFRHEKAFLFFVDDFYFIFRHFFKKQHFLSKSDRKCSRVKHSLDFFIIFKQSFESSDQNENRKKISALFCQSLHSIVPIYMRLQGSSTFAFLDRGRSPNDLES
jgi:hypothetical protein